jgi:uncharacterized protein YjbI with pentapeptide repeats
MNLSSLQKMLQDHKVWLETSGAEGKRAKLSGSDLSGANLACANLTRANLLGANLSSANLSGADLSRANLTRANLTCANLLGANLSGANLSVAYLAGANLSGAVLPHVVYQFFVGKHSAVATPTELVIGCVRYPWEYWLKEYKNIGNNNNYTTLEIKQHIIMIKAMHKVILLAKKTP